VESLKKYTEKYIEAVVISRGEGGITTISLDEAFAAKLKKISNKKDHNKQLPQDSTCVTQTGTGNSFTIVTDENYSQLGRAMAVGDFNKDGLDDIVIGAPGTGEPGNPEAGAVYVVYGRQGITGQESIIVGQGHYQNATSVSYATEIILETPIYGCHSIAMASPI
jgi:hypothetical protein